MTNINVTPSFVLAGEATFTVSNGENEHHTYVVYKSKPSTEFPEPKHFVKALVGADDKYAYLGMVVLNTNDKIAPAIKLTGRSRFKAESSKVSVLQWALRVIWQHHYFDYQLPEPYTIHHDGKCGRCGAKLTNPKSLDTGLGPECADMAGVEWAERSNHPKLPYGERRHHTRTVHTIDDDTSPRAYALARNELVGFFTKRMGF